VEHPKGRVAALHRGHSAGPFGKGILPVSFRGLAFEDLITSFSCNFTVLLITEQIIEHPVRMYPVPLGLKVVVSFAPRNKPQKILDEPTDPGIKANPGVGAFEPTPCPVGIIQVLVEAHGALKIHVHVLLLS
jgi:hypothetical protein